MEAWKEVDEKWLTLNGGRLNSGTLGFWPAAAAAGHRARARARTREEKVQKTTS